MFSNSIQILILANFIVGNKNDLENRREVSVEEGRKFADKNNVKFIEITALNLHECEKVMRILFQGY